ncbi:MAG: DMT family transporter [Clostridia bacterium]|nr:DMT family transporter [Clostridia bacterium]
MRKRSFVFIILASVLWGTSGIFVHYLAPLGFSSLQMSSVRGTVAAVCFAIYILIKDRKLFSVSFKDLAVIALSGIAMYGCGTCYYASMQMTSVSTAVMLMYTAPVIVMTFSVIFLGEKLTKIKLISLIAMIFGCGFITGVIGGLKFNPAGILVGLLSGVSYSTYIIITRIEMQKKINAVTAVFYCFLFMTILALIAAPPAPIFETALKEPLKAFPLMIGVGICTSILPYLFYTLSLKHIPAGTAASLAVLEPMAATLFSVMLLGEKLSLSSVCGIILILGAVLLLSKTND